MSSRFRGPGTKARVSKEGGEFPKWTRKGQELLYNRRGVEMAVSMDGEDELRIGEPLRALQFAGWRHWREYFRRRRAILGQCLR